MQFSWNVFFLLLKLSLFINQFQVAVIQSVHIIISESDLCVGGERRTDSSAFITDILWQR